MNRLGYDPLTILRQRVILIVHVNDLMSSFLCFGGPQFPWVLNMEPYTVSGMARQDCSGDGGEGRGDGTSGGSPRKKVTISENYELVGVVVHSGQAHAGHYYSFIKDRR